MIYLFFMFEKQYNPISRLESPRLFALYTSRLSDVDRKQIGKYQTKKTMFRTKNGILCVEKMLKCTVFARKKLVIACFSDYSERIRKLIYC